MFDFEKLRAEKERELQSKRNAAKKDLQAERNCSERAPVEWRNLRAEFEKLADDRTPILDGQPIRRVNDVFMLGNVTLAIRGGGKEPYRAGVYSQSIALPAQVQEQSLPRYIPQISGDGKTLVWKREGEVYSTAQLAEKLWRELFDEYIRIDDRDSGSKEGFPLKVAAEQWMRRQ